MTPEERSVATKLSDVIGDLARLEDPMSADVLWRIARDLVGIARFDRRGESPSDKQDRINQAQAMMLDADRFQQDRASYAQNIADLCKRQ